MKITDLRKELKETSRENLEEAFVELYKTLTAPSKRNVDAMLPIWLSGEKTSTKKNEKTKLSIKELADSIDWLDYHRNNRSFTKSRSELSSVEKKNWRFWVHDWIKQLLAIPSDSFDYDESCHLLMKLMEILREANLNESLNTEHPYRSISWPPKKLAEDVTKHVLEDPQPGRSILNELYQAITGELWCSGYDDDEPDDLLNGAITGAEKAGRKEEFLQGLEEWKSSRKTG